jgi:hypothetical protein
MLVVPVGQDHRQHVHVRAAGHPFEEVAALRGQPVVELVRLGHGGHGLDHVGQVERHARCIGRQGEQEGEQGAVGSADVDDPGRAAKIVARDGMPLDPVGEVGHGTREPRHGRALVDAVLPIVHAAATDVFGTLTKAERETLVELLGRVQRRLADLAGRPFAAPEPRRPPRLRGR